MAELLFELGTEELPARFVVPALDDIERTFLARCAELGLKHGAVRRFGTPRRVALLVSDVASRTDDVLREVQGPSVKAAFDDKGQPKTPAIKFAEGQGVPVSQLKRVTTPKGEYLCASVQEKGKPALELLVDVLGLCTRKIDFPKSMRWGDVEASFGRPLHWIVALLDNEVIPVVFSDVKSGRQTQGHRFLAPGWIELGSPGAYEAALKKAHVVPDIAERRALVHERVTAAAARAGGTLLEDEALLDQVTNLVEQPSPVVGSFEERHLDLPPEVLVQEMKSHQRYFSLTDAKGKLLPRFIAVSNTPVRDEAVSVKGYERVLRARLSDGRFFFDEDRRTKLMDRVPRLHRVVWNRDLNSTYAEKVDRIRALSVWLADATGRGAERATIERAASLCKADLVTGMVGEFPELQGVMGREYALHDGEPKAVALAISEHYLPRGAGDALPTSDAGALIGLADRLDSLVGIFASGKKPTGAADPHGLRRQCLAIVHLTVARGYRFSLAAAIDQSLSLLEPKVKALKKAPTPDAVKAQVLEFFAGRLESLWRDTHRADVADAVLAAGFDDLVAASRRIEALSAWVAKPEFSALAGTFRRVANILDKQGGELGKVGTVSAPIDTGLLQDAEEKALHQAFSKTESVVQKARKADDFATVFEELAALRPVVDAFFDKVMVMAEDEKVKLNRLMLLKHLRDTFISGVADFGRIQSES